MDQGFVLGGREAGLSRPPSLPQLSPRSPQQPPPVRAKHPSTKIRNISPAIRRDAERGGLRKLPPQDREPRFSVVAVTPKGQTEDGSSLPGLQQRQHRTSNPFCGPTTLMPMCWNYPKVCASGREEGRRGAGRRGEGRATPMPAEGRGSTGRAACGGDRLNLPRLIYLC